MSANQQVNCEGFTKGLSLTADLKKRLEKELTEQEIISKKDLPKFSDKAEVKGVTKVLAWIVTILTLMVMTLSVMAPIIFITYLIAGMVPAIFVFSFMAVPIMGIPEGRRYFIFFEPIVEPTVELINKILGTSFNSDFIPISESIYYGSSNIINKILGKKNPYAKEVVEEVKAIQSAMHKSLNDLAVDEKALEKFNRQYNVSLKGDKYYNFVRNLLFLRSFAISEVIQGNKRDWLDNQQLAELTEIAIEDFWSKLPKEKREELIKDLSASDNITNRKIRDAIKTSNDQISASYENIHENAGKAVSKVLEEECKKQIEAESKDFIGSKKLKHDVGEGEPESVKDKISKAYYSSVDQNVREIVAKILKEEYSKRLTPEFRNFIKSGILNYDISAETDENLRDSIRKAYEEERNKVYVEEKGTVYYTVSEEIPRVDRVINAEKDVQDFYVRKLKEERKKAPATSLALS